MSHVFLSHNSQDKPQVLRLARALARYGVEVWIDVWELSEGDEWEPQLAQALEAAVTVLACVGCSGAGPWHDRELDRARLQKTTVELVLLPGWHSQVGRLGLDKIHCFSLVEEEFYEETVRTMALRLRGDGRANAAVATNVRGPFDGRPYPGLAAFQREHAGWFFGRERKIAEILHSLKQPGWVWLVGNSGSGKSSLVRAGVLPEFVRAGVGAGVVLRPSESFGAAVVQLLHSVGAEVSLSEQREIAMSPSLALQLLRRGLQGGASSPRLIVVDQFEEVFSPAGVEPPMRSLLKALADIASDPGLSISVLAVLRADYFARALAVDVLRDVQDAGLQFALSGANRRELRRAIRLPAIAAGGGVEDAVVDSLVEAVGSDDDGLPLLQVLLEQLWDRATAPPCRDGVIRYAHLRELAGATSDDVIDTNGLLHAGLRHRIAALALSQAEREAAFEQLVQVDMASGPTRRRAPRNSFPTWLHAALDRLTDARLAVSGGGEEDEVGWVELTHEAVIRAWPECRKWAQLNVEQLSRRSEVEDAADDWRNADGGVSYLWRGPRLDRALEVLAGQALSHEGRAFLTASRKHGLRNRRIWGAVAIGGLLVTFVLVGWALISARAAERKAAEAKAEYERAEMQTQLVRAATVVNTTQVHEDLLVNSLLLLAVNESPTPAGAAMAAHDLAKKVYPEHVLWGPDKGGLDVEYHPGGHEVMAASADGTAWIWSADGRGRARVLEGHHHGWRVTGASYSPDGKHVVTSSADHSARIWPLDGKRPAKVLRGHKGQVSSAAFGSDGQRVLTTSIDGTARIWPVVGDGAAVVLPCGSKPGSCVAAMAPDGSKVITGSASGRVQLWNLGAPAVAVDLAELEAGIQDVSFASDGSRALLAAANGVVLVQNLSGRGEARRLQGHVGGVASAVFSVDGKRIVTASEDGTARIWRSDGRGQEMVLDAARGPLRGALFSPSGERVLTIAQDGVRVWRIGESSPLWLNHANVTAAAFSPDGTRVVTVAADRRTLVWRIVGGREPRALHGHGRSLTSVIFSDDGRFLLSGSKDDTARVWALHDRTPPRVLAGHRKNVTCVAYSPDGQRVATGSEDGEVRVWPVRRNAEPNVLKGHAKRIEAISFSPDGASLVSASKDGTARLWRVDGRGEVRVLGGHSKAVTAAAFSPDGKRVVTTSADRSVRIWRTDAPGEPQILEGHAKKVVGAMFSPGGERVLTASRDGTARLWRLDGAAPPQVLGGHRRGLVSARFDNDGNRVVTASDDGTARLWWVDGDGGFVVLKGHERRLVGAAFTADGRHVMTASKDGSVRIWSATGGGEPLLLKSPSSGLVAAAFSPDGAFLATASNDGIVRLWRVHWKGLRELLRERTSACLTIAARVRYLGESRDDALRICTACQQRYQRSPSRCDETVVDAL